MLLCTKNTRLCHYRLDSIVFTHWYFNNMCLLLTEGLCGTSCGGRGSWLASQTQHSPHRHLNHSDGERLPSLGAWLLNQDDQTQRERPDQHNRGASEGSGCDAGGAGSTHALSHHARRNGAAERGTSKLPLANLWWKRDAADDIQGTWLWDDPQVYAHHQSRCEYKHLIMRRPQNIDLPSRLH